MSNAVAGRRRRRQVRTLACGLVAGAIGCAAAPVSTTARCDADRAVLASQADVARLASCTSLRTVVVRSGGALDVSALRGLTTITGDLVIGPTVGIDSIGLGALRVVAGAIRVVGNGLLQGVYLPKLERAGGVEVSGNVALTTLSLPRLAAIGGALRVTGNASLEAIDTAALATVGGALVLAGAPRLTLLEIGSLRAVGQVELDAPGLAPELAAQLRALAAPGP